MRYQIFSLQQSALVELGISIEESLLLDWILNWKDGNGMKREFIEEVQDIGYWINYETVVNELPILFKQATNDMDNMQLEKLLRNNKDKVSRMLKGNLSKVLKAHKMVYKGKGAKLGSMIFVTINRDMIDKLKNSSEKEKAPTCEVEDIQKSKTNNDNSIHENKEEYAIKLMEENIEVVEIDDVEAKNKLLMENEKTFVPSARGWR